MKQGAYCDCQAINLINNSKKKLYWQLLDLRYNVTLDNDIFRVLHSSLPSSISSSTKIFSFKINFVPTKSGTYKTRILLYISHNNQTPYTYIELTGKLLMPNLIFSIRYLMFPPVPLDIESGGTVCVRTKGFEK
ncbi:unnamed protein product [Rotaria sordida]|uniref:Uncharacterized protein n=3 Tax=Rotaria sordida TaxID=392033 RepID=A0A819K3W9_9BILA|nr:unnamed protein product [Rotaria sordida]CAF3844419.1 unnamed protein product [Rotaria sordida]CAF3939492.1 unnamed protein product [Rotaria sordida]